MTYAGGRGQRSPEAQLRPGLPHEVPDTPVLLQLLQRRPLAGESPTYILPRAII